jgi:hypothetical protein
MMTAHTMRAVNLADLSDEEMLNPAVATASALLRAIDKNVPVIEAAAKLTICVLGELAECKADAQTAENTMRKIFQGFTMVITSPHFGNRTN